MTSARWSVWQITLVLFPFGAGAVAVNIFFASLISSWLGCPVISPQQAIAAGAIAGIPATYWFARHIRKLMDEADQED